VEISEIPENINVNGKIIVEPKSISNAFNDYFGNVGNKLSNAIPVDINSTFTCTSLIENLK